MKGSWPILRHYHNTCVVGLNKTKRNLNLDCRSNPGLPKYEAGG